MRKILVLGSGCLGKLISQKLAQCKCFHVRNLSIRNASAQNIDLSADIIIDCMDPASFDIREIDDILQKVIFLRNRIVNHSANISLYCYISSAMLYKESYLIIDEDTPINPLFVKASSHYVRHKYHTEQLVLKYFPQSCCIFRPVSLWSHKFTLKSNSFFSDLLNARASQTELHSHPSDSHIITYLSFFDAANMICHFLASFPDRHYDVVNITSACWSSRHQLKTEINSRTLLPTLFGRRVTSKYCPSANPSLLELP